jgi:hypothetical protein
MLAAHLRHRLTGFRQAQHADDLLLAELTLAHPLPPDLLSSLGSLAYPLGTFPGSVPDLVHVGTLLSGGMGLVGKYTPA